MYGAIKALVVGRPRIAGIVALAALAALWAIRGSIFNAGRAAADAACDLAFDTHAAQQREQAALDTAENLKTKLRAMTRAQEILSDSLRKQAEAAERWRRLQQSAQRRLDDARTTQEGRDFLDDVWPAGPADWLCAPTYSGRPGCDDPDGVRDPEL